MDIKEIENKLLTGNEKYVKFVNENLEEKNLHNSLIYSQKPYILIISCSDSRVIPEKIFSANRGELFVIRTAGNVINEGELATVEYALEHLNIKYVLVMGHTGCGAVHATLHNESGKYLSPIIKRIKKNISGIDDEVLASEINAKKESEFLKKLFEDKKDVHFTYGLYDLVTNICKIY